MSYLPFCSSVWILLNLDLKLSSLYFIKRWSDDQTVLGLYFGFTSSSASFLWRITTAVDDSVSFCDIIVLVIIVMFVGTSTNGLVITMINFNIDDHTQLAPVTLVFQCSMDTLITLKLSLFFILKIYWSFYIMSKNLKTLYHYL